MKAHEPELLTQLQVSEEDKPVDMVWVLRGGGTDVLTLITCLSELQARFPHNHIAEFSPYILADSAGAYPAAGLVAPKPIDPLELPEIFTKKVPRYLSLNREEAEAALREDIGDILVSETVLPVTISSVETTETLTPAYFSNFPEIYCAQRPGFIAPPNQNDDIPLAKAVMASSAFPLILGQYQINGRSFVDLAFMETHAANLQCFRDAHTKAHPDRRLVCVIFGNNYVDYQPGENAPFRQRDFQRHIGDFIRLRAHRDLLRTSTSLFGANNVFDLSMVIRQPIIGRLQSPSSSAFRSDDLAIRERIEWTHRQFKNSQHHKDTLDKLSEIIKRGCLPQGPLLPSDLAFEAWKPVALTPQEKLLSRVKEIAPALAFMMAVSSETLKPMIEQSKPVVASGLSALKTGATATHGWLKEQWKRAGKPALDEAYHFLMHGETLKDAETRRLLQSRLSEKRKLSESDHTPL